MGYDKETREKYYQKLLEESRNRHKNKRNTKKRITLKDWEKLANQLKPKQ